MNMDAAERAELELLRVFFQKVALLSMDHSVIHGHKVVPKDKLDPVLARVDADWAQKARQWEKRKWLRPRKVIKTRTFTTASTHRAARDDDPNKLQHPMA